MTGEVIMLLVPVQHNMPLLIIRAELYRCEGTMPIRMIIESPSAEIEM